MTALDSRPRTGPSSPWPRRVMVGGAAAAAVSAGALLVMMPPGSGADLYPPCPFKAITGLDCPFCGGLRGTHELLTGNLTGAADQNILVPLLALLAIAAATVTVLRRRGVGAHVQWGALLRLATPYVVTFVLLFWVARNVAFVPFLRSGFG